MNVKSLVLVLKHVIIPKADINVSVWKVICLNPTTTKDAELKVRFFFISDEFDSLDVYYLIFS